MPTDLHRLFFALAWFNAVILVFNLLPIYPLDGGQILQAALWPLLGRSTSLGVSAGIGILAGAGLCVLAISYREWWLATMTVFLLFGALRGFARARMVARLARAERRPNRFCPGCLKAAPVGTFWLCSLCLTWYDLFEPTACSKGITHRCDGLCPECGRRLGADGWAATCAADTNTTSTG